MAAVFRPAAMPVATRGVFPFRRGGLRLVEALPRPSFTGANLR